MADACDLDLSVVVPAFNAAEFIANSMRMLSQGLRDRVPSFEILVIDDGSADETSSIVSKLCQEIPALRLHALPENRGKFGAIKAGIQLARGRCCLFTDADIPYQVDAIPYMSRLVNERGFHVVIGDRTLDESRYSSEMTVVRRLCTQTFSFLVRMLITGGLFDTQCGLKAFRKDVAKALFPLIRDDGFSGDVELLWIALKYNLEVKRIPVRLERIGPSSVKVGRHAFRMLRRIVQLRSNWRHGLYESAELARIARQEY